VASLAVATFVIISAILLLVLLDNRSKRGLIVRHDDEETGLIVKFPQTPIAPKEGQGVGAGSNGRVGFQSHNGEGSGPKLKRSTGGGSSGLHDPLPAQVGKLPQPSEIHAPLPKLPPVQKSALPVAGIDIDPALWKNQAVALYGDPRSKSSEPSNGPGDGGGMGTNKGTGIGEGEGPGFGPGRDGNIGGDRKGLGCCGPSGGQGNNVDDPDRAYPAPQVTERARVLAKPEPQYTEEARRNAVTGSVVLRVVFSRTGEVTNIRAVQSLPFGLTERAIAAARLIRFRPASRDGHPVNVYMQLEYNFNLY
jgi:TonB family protein